MIDEALAAVRAWRADGREAALATVVRVEGSAPRASVPSWPWPPVARWQARSVAVAWRATWSSMRWASSPAATPSFGATGSATSRASVGLMCGGTIEVLVEPVEGARAGLIELFTALVARGGPPPARSRCPGRCARDAPGPRRGGGGRGTDTTDAVHDRIVPAPRVWIVGAGHVAEHVAAYAARAGLVPLVVDPRRLFAQQPRFEGVLVIPDWPDRAFAEHGLRDDDAVVVLSHDPKIDEPALLAALGAKPAPRYVGAIGSRRAQDDRRARLRAAGLTEDQLARSTRRSASTSAAASRPRSASPSWPSWWPPATAARRTDGEPPMTELLIRVAPWSMARAPRPPRGAARRRRAAAAPRPDADRRPWSGSSRPLAWWSRPGFIDLHSHSGLWLLHEPRHEPKVRQGVTTEVIGVDGLVCAADEGRGSRGPGGDERRARRPSRYRRSTGTRWLVPRPLRRGGRGERGAPDRELRAPDLRHRLGGRSGRPHGPGRYAGHAPRRHGRGRVRVVERAGLPAGAYATTEELADLTTAAAREGGFYHTHVRYELGDRYLDPFREALAIGDMGHGPVHLTHFYHRRNYPGGHEPMLALVDDAGRRGRT